MGAQSPRTRDEAPAARQAGCGRRASFCLTEKQIQRFLDAHAESGCAGDTIRQYRSAILQFYEFLPEGKQVSRDTLSQWNTLLLEQGYSSSTACTRLSAVNGLLDFLGRRDLQWRAKLERTQADAAELTREEYIRLLQEAKRQENITLYLLVKTIASAGLSVQSLNGLTREAVDRGEVRTERKLYSQTVALPAGLRRELLDYAMREGVRSGPVFRTAAGEPLRRTAVTCMISRLGEAAGLEPGKANPRSLKRLYQSTFAEYQRQADEWMRTTYARLLAEEDQEAGWLAGRG